MVGEYTISESPGSARVSRAGDRVLAIANLLAPRNVLGCI